MRAMAARLGAARFSVRSVLVVGSVALVIGAWIGNSVAFGSKPLTVKTGEAFLHSTDNGLTSFDTDDPDDQLTFWADAVFWSSSTGGQHGDGPPPCLKEGRAVPVRIGYTLVEHPGGGGHPVVAWLECLG